MNNNIKRFIQSKGLRTASVIEKAGLSSSSFYEIMNGKAVPSLMNARKIAIALDSSVNEIFPEDTSKGDSNEKN